MRALCKTWTEGIPAVFAVLDGLGTGPATTSSASPRRATRRSSAQWTTVTNWTNQGSPYLWWTGPDQAAILQAVVNWGLSARPARRARQGRGHRRRPGLRPGGPQRLPAARPQEGRRQPRWSRPSTPTRTRRPPPTPRPPWSSSSSGRPGSTSVIPLIPFNVFYPVLRAETRQQYFPKLLLSDYESSIESRSGSSPSPTRRRSTARRASPPRPWAGSTTPVPGAQGGYDPGVRSCWTVWHKAYPQIPPGQHERLHRGAGAGRRAGARPSASSPPRPRKAGKDLNRRTFVDRHVQDHELPGHGYSPVLSFGPDKFYGPTAVPGGQPAHQHTRRRHSASCPRTRSPRSTCWVRCALRSRCPPLSR